MALDETISWRGSWEYGKRCGRLRRDFSFAAAVVDDRLNEIELRLSENGRCLPLLALPSYEHGWIEASQLLDRIRAYSAAGEELPMRDLETAILRLIPSSKFRREELADLPEAIQRVLLYASGEQPEFAVAKSESKWSWVFSIGTRTATDSNPVQWWLAAGRYRNHRGSLPELASLPVPKVAFGLAAASVHWNFENTSAARDLAAKEVQELRKEHGHFELRKLLDPKKSDCNRKKLTGVFG